jgi:hypothetical protein
MNNLSNVLGGFNANEVEISSGYEPIPEGEYCAMITSVELKDSKSGGNFLEFDFTVQGTTHDGKVLKDRLNIVNSNETAQRIAKESLAKICLALGIATPKDTSDFQNKRLKIKVAVKPGVGTYFDKFGVEKPSQPQNEIKGYFPINSTAAQVQEQPQQQQEPQAQQDSPVKQRAWT